MTALMKLALPVAAALALTFVALLSTPINAAERVDAHRVYLPGGSFDRDTVRWFKTARDSAPSVLAPQKLAIIACRVAAKQPGRSNSEASEPDWILPVECMRVIETVTDAAAMTNLWLRQMTPNLGDHGTCAEVAMNYAPEWEATHSNWLVVKVGCPTKIVDADGRTIGWHMPECQGTLPGTAYPLRCRFDPSEI